MKISREILVADLRRVRDMLGKIPSVYEYSDHGKYSGATYKRTWGSWNKALLEIFGDTNRETGTPLHECVCPVCKGIFMQKTSFQKFCSRSCSATSSNMTSPKKRKTKTCKFCKELIPSSYTYCKKCIEDGNHIKNGFLAKKTLEEIEYKNGSNRYGVVRQHSQLVMKNVPKICSVCGYDKHAEICHRKSIREFDRKATVGEINDPTNLILLCPNCHWELDHGMKR